MADSYRREGLKNGGRGDIHISVSGGQSFSSDGYHNWSNNPNDDIRSVLLAIEDYVDDARFEGKTPNKQRIVRTMAKSYRQDLKLMQDKLNKGLEVLQSLKKGSQEYSSLHDDISTVQEIVQSLKDKLTFLKSINAFSIDNDKKGNVYTADIPEDYELLDWDASLDRQSSNIAPLIRKALDTINNNPAELVALRFSMSAKNTKSAQAKLQGIISSIMRMRKFNQHFLTPYEFRRLDEYKQIKSLLHDENTIDDFRLAVNDLLLYPPRIPEHSSTGENLYWALADILRSDEAASNYLNKLGIPGHRYLDRFSRDKGDGTHNYVIWNMDKITITGLSEDSDDDARQYFREHQNESSEQYSQIIGETGAQRLDAQEGVTTRMDNLNVARQMEKDGKSTRNLWLATGWMRGKDHKWRYEIPDGKIKLSKLKEYRKVTDEIDAIYKKIDDDPNYIPSSREEEIINYNIHIDNFFDAPELFNAYPQLRDIVTFFSDLGDAAAMYFPGPRIIEIDRNINSAKELKVSIIHELQHAVQEIEGFATGWGYDENKDAKYVKADKKIQTILGSINPDTLQKISNIFSADDAEKVQSLISSLTPDELIILENLKAAFKERNKRSSELFSRYERHAGEVEARNTETRSNWGEKRRRRTPLDTTEDIARDEQIVGRIYPKRKSSNSRKSGNSFVSDELIEHYNQLALHGSPNIINGNRFNLKYVGTGEGGDMFGYGIYLAQDKNVAESYRTAGMVHEPFIIYSNGEHLNADDLEHKMYSASFMLSDDERKIFSAYDFIQHIKDLSYGKFSSINDAVDDYVDNICFLKRIPKKDTKTRDNIYRLVQPFIPTEVLPSKPLKGNLYSADIPEDFELLDWDAPMSEQPQKVIDALKRSGLYEFDNETGEHLYKRIARDLGGYKQASMKLNDIGIPGHRYWDAGSRKKGEGTHNFVIWNTDTLHILGLSDDSDDDAQDYFRTQKYYDEYLDSLDNDSDVTEYSGDDENARLDRLANDTLDALDNQPEQYSQIIGEQGARNLDDTQGTASRMENLEIAQNMQKAGKDALSIRLATGWELGHDGKWKYEILDGDINPDFIALGNRVEGKLHKQYHLGEIFNSDELFNAYPQLKNMPVFFNRQGFGTYLDMDANEIWLEYGMMHNKARSALIHEIQHAIQRIEGFSVGSSPASYGYRNVQAGKLTWRLWDRKAKSIWHSLSPSRQGYWGYVVRKINENNGYDFDDIINEYLPENERDNFRNWFDARINAREGKDYGEPVISPYEAYRRTGGEVEARNTEHRLGMSEQERRNTTLAGTEDVQPEQQIIRRVNSNGRETFSQSMDTPEQQIEQVRRKYQNTDMWLKAPNGKDTNLTEKQWLQVRTPNFKAWFGDWENDTDNSSKILDDNGEPLVVWHGNPNAVLEYDNEGKVLRSKEGNGIYRLPFSVFSTDDYSKDSRKMEFGAFFHKKAISGYGGTAPFFLNIRNPFNAEGPFYEDSFKILAEQNYDGLIRYKTGTASKNNPEFIAFYPEQIKSAINNNGNFDTSNPDIYHQSINDNNDSVALVDADGRQLLIPYDPPELEKVYRQYEGTDKLLKAPNGKKSKLEPTTWLMVRTPAFKQWFGDWENDKENASKALDANGEPLVVYHGTTVGGFSVFETKGQGQTKNTGAWFSSSKLIAQGYQRSSQAGHIYSTFLNLRNPYIIDAQGKTWDSVGNTSIRNKKSGRIIQTDDNGNLFDGKRDAEYYIRHTLSDTFFENYEILQDKIMTTDDFVRAVKKGKLGTGNHDGVIIRNVKDNAGYAGNDSKADDFIIFKPIQAKSDSNRGSFSTTNPDIYFQTANDDKRYFDALNSGDMDTARSIIDAQAKRKGYSSANEHRMNHRPADSHDGDNPNMANVMNSGFVPDNYWTHPEYYLYSQEDYEAFRAVTNAIRNNDTSITVYRAVPKDVKEDNFRNGDWVTPSRSYAQLHARANIKVPSRIISKSVPLAHLWWDGNAITEWGYDDGLNYAYRNTKNSRKLNDTVTYDTEGSIVPPSERFNYRRPETYYQNNPSVQHYDTFSSSETENAYSERSKHSTQEGTIERITLAAHDFLHGLKGDFPELAGNETFTFAREVLRKMNRQTEAKALQAVQTLDASLKGLDKRQFNIFSRLMLINDIYTFKRHNPDATLPLNFTPDTLKAERLKFSALAQKDSAIMDAVQAEHNAHTAIQKQLADSAEKLGMIKFAEKVKRYDFYFLDYARLLGGDDINANYVEAVAEFRNEQLQDIERMNALLELREKHDIKQKLIKQHGKDWQRHIPNGYKIFNPLAGRFIKTAHTLTENILDMAMEQAGKQSGISNEAIQDFRRKLSDNSGSHLLVLPAELADTLTNMTKAKERGPVGKIAKAITTAWKKYVLFFPLRTVKYNIRNITGDLDAAIAGNPHALTYLRQAMSELWDAYYGDRSNITPELREFQKRGGAITIQTTQELGDYKQLKEFQNLFNDMQDKDLAAWRKLTRNAWGLIDKFAWTGVQNFSDFREQWLRYATYLSYLHQMQDNNGTPNNWGASVKEEVLSLPDIRDRAFKMSNELLGAYDQVSETGRNLRDIAIPFYSWLEVNAKRYYQLIKNGITEDNAGDFASRFLKGQLANAPYYAFKLSKTYLMINLLSMLFAAFNHLVWPDDEDKLPPDIQSRPHITLGHDTKGNVLYFDRVGAVLDNLEWFGQDNSPFAPFAKDVKDIFDGKQTFMDFLGKISSAPVNKAVNALNPFLKLPAELLTGKSMYPEATNPRNIRDNAQYIAQSLGLNWPYKAITGQPRSDWQEFKNVFLYSANADEAAYFFSLGKVREFQEKVLHRRFEGFASTQRGETLRRLKTALRLDDKDAVQRYLREYYGLAGTRQGLKTSLRSMNPLSGLSKAEQKQFLRWISPDDRKYLNRANSYFHKLADKFLR